MSEQYMVKLEIGGIAVYSDPFQNYDKAEEAMNDVILSLANAGFDGVIDLISVVEV